MENRPFSRRGESRERTPSALSVMESSRPQTVRASAMRPPSVMGQHLRIPQTASNRINTGLAMPPGSAMLADHLPGHRISTAQQQRRQVLDKRYYEGLIRQKIRAISQEVERLSSVVESQQQQEAAALLYTSKVKEVAQEVTELQGELMDYNQVLDRLHTGQDAMQAAADYDQVKADNMRDAVRVQKLFQQNEEIQKQIAHMEAQIRDEKNTTEKVLEEMDESTRERYSMLKEENDRLVDDLNMQSQHIEQLKTQVAHMQDELSSSQIKQETVNLHQKLRERQGKKEQLLEEAKQKETPSQEREQLLRRVRDDNAEIAAMERQIAQATQQRNTLAQEIDVVQQDLEESSSDRHQKLKELRQREETMDNFLRHYDESKGIEGSKIEVLEGNIQIALKRMTEGVKYQSMRHGAMEFAIMKEFEGNLEELEQKLGSEELVEKEAKLLKNFNKIRDLQLKVATEETELKLENDQMRKEMAILSDLNSLRESRQHKRKQLTDQREFLLSSQKPDDMLNPLREKHKQLYQQLNENETFVQIKTLEKKLRWIEESNAALSEQLASKKIQLDVEEPRTAATNLINKYNALLKKK